MSDGKAREAADRVRVKKEHLVYIAALGGGVLLWLGTMAISGRNEAWDSPLYWSAAYPLCIAIAGALGFIEPTRAWRWGLAIMLVQPVVMVLASGGGFSLLPLGLIMFAVLALPAVLGARIGAWVARHRAAD
jgi:hypothetical protein